MLAYAIVFLIITVLCAVFGFAGLGLAAFAGIARILFFVFLVALLGSIVIHVARRA